MNYRKIRATLADVLACVLLLTIGWPNPVHAGTMYAIGPSSSVAFQGTASVINTGNGQAQSSFTLPSLQPGFTDFEIVNGQIWGVDGSSAMWRWGLDGTFIGTSGLFDNAVDLEVFGGQAYAIGPSSSVAFQGTASVINTANGQAQSSFTLTGLQPGFTDFEIVNGQIWGVDGSSAMRRWALNGAFVGTSGLFDNAVDLEVFGGGQAYAIGPSSSVAFQGTASVINTGNGQAQSSFTLAGLQPGFTDFEFVNNQIWGVDGSSSMRRWALNGAFVGGSGLFDNAVDLEAVPIPAAVWLFGSALALLGWGRRRRLDS